MRGTTVAVTGRVRFVVLIALLVACGDPPEVAPDAAPPDAGPRGQGSEATSDLVINEVSPRGAGADWVELYNRGDAAIDLCEYILTDAVDRLDHYLPLGGVMPPDPCPAALLEAGARVVVYADDTAIADPIDPLHAPFELAVADEIHLLRIDGVVADGLLYLYPPGPNVQATVTLARDPDGTGLFFERAPTPGGAN